MNKEINIKLVLKIICKAGAVHLLMFVQLFTVAPIEKIGGCRFNLVYFTKASAQRRKAMANHPAVVCVFTNHITKDKKSTVKPRIRANKKANTLNEYWLYILLIFS
ncbi:hypothetical protein DHW03_07620 [Pedobacter yonginense]|uniref:Uncharacterized protein n=1 Tax=Pedobacter yonginense TaxID=651869 RepID=A0A317ENJ9_9SPHI|nr:hypothetical protein DHW03_07620 [Pedobacter yonginense]